MMAKRDHNGLAHYYQVRGSANLFSGTQMSAVVSGLLSTCTAQERIRSLCDYLLPIFRYEPWKARQWEKF